MFTVSLLAIIVVFSAFLAGFKRRAYWLKGSFVVIFLFLALRYEYGNDYDNYLQVFLNINQSDNTGDIEKYSLFEPGWIFLCQLFKPVGFFAMSAVLALFNCAVYYHFIKKYVPPVYYWLAVFIYVCNPNLMLVQSSAMRQSVAISLFLFSIDYLLKKDALRFCLCVSLAALFHTSALILFPVYFLGLFNWKINNTVAVCAFLIFLLTYVFGEYFIPSLQQFTDSYFGRYDVYAYDAGKLGTGFGVIVFSSLFGFVLYSARSQNAEFSLLVKLLSINYLLMALGLFMMMIGRVGLYFLPAAIAVFPLIVFNSKNPVLKYSILAILIFMTLYSYYVFFSSDTYKEAFAVYKTIFSAPEIY